MPKKRMDVYICLRVYRVGVYSGHGYLLKYALCPLDLRCPTNLYVERIHVRQI